MWDGLDKYSIPELKNCSFIYFLVNGLAVITRCTTAVHICLSWGCKLQILVSVGTESHHICLFRDRLGLCIKKLTKKCIDLPILTDHAWGSQSGRLSAKQSVLSHTHFCLLKGFNFNLPTSILVTFKLACVASV